MEQNLPPLPPVIFENGLYYELRGEQYYPCLLPPEPDTTEDKLLETIIRQMAEAQGVNEELKAMASTALWRTWAAPTARRRSCYPNWSKLACCAGNGRGWGSRLHCTP